MPAPPPKVSVVIPVFNAESSVGTALESVFAQTFSDFEVVVVDDGSTDGSAAVLQRWADRVTVLAQSNGGPAQARNAGIRASRGELVAFLDADDRWLPEKLARQVEYFALYPETGLLHTAALDTTPPATGPAGVSASPRAPRHAFCDLFHTDLDVNTLTVMVPRAVLDHVGLFDERREIHVEDWDLWLRIAAEYPVGYLPVPTAVHQPGGGMSSAVEKTFEGQAAVIRKTFPLCNTACPMHPSSAGRCRARRWHRFHWERGYARMRAGNRAGARLAFLAALRHRPFDLGTYVQLAGTFAGTETRNRLRGLRRRADGLPPSASPTGLPAGRPASAHQAAVDQAAADQAVADQAVTDRAPLAPAISLVHDTLYRRTRRAVIEHLHDLDDFLDRRGNRRRILFQAASPMSFVIFRPVYERLREDPRIEFWFTAAGRTWEPARLYERVGIDHHVIPTERARWMKVDACIDADFWDNTWLLRRTRRVHLFHGVAGKYGLDAPLELAPVIAAYERLLFPNRDRLDRYTDAGLVPPGSDRAALVGYPKVDRLVDGSLDASGIMATLDLDRRRTTVIYAPTWSPHSSLNLCGEQIVSRLCDAGFNVIVKLHDRSYDSNPRGSGGVDWAARFSAYRDHPRVRLVADPDSTPYLAVADAMVTDHSSIGFEYALLDRPLVVVDCPELIAAARVTRSKVTRLRAAAEVVSSPGQVVRAVVQQLEEPCLHRTERLTLGSHFFHQPGTASLRAAAVIYRLLALPSLQPSQVQAATDPAAIASAR